MKIIYDATKAEQEKLRLDTEIPERNRKYKARNRIIAVVTIVLAIALVFGSGAGMRYISTLDLGVWHFVIGFAALLIAVFAGVGLYLFYRDNIDIIMPAEDYYTPAIQYHCAVENKKILNIKTLGNPPWKLYLVLEDEDHVVTEKEINLHFSHKLRTDISETRIDLDERVVYTPYNEEDT